MSRIFKLLKFIIKYDLCSDVKRNFTKNEKKPEWAWIIFFDENPLFLKKIIILLMFPLKN
jgi:hypothetical protein